MNRDPIDRERILALYSDEGFFNRLYAKVRLWRLDFDFYRTLLPPEGLLIDIGCGRGILANFLALAFPGSRVIGIDRDAKRIETAVKTVGERPNIAFSVQDVVRWKPPPCNGVVMADFLHHLSPEEQTVLLRKTYESLEKGGLLLISDCDAGDKHIYRFWASYLSDILLYFSRSHFRTAEEWKSLLCGIGFSTEPLNLPNPFFSTLLLICRK